MRLGFVSARAATLREAIWTDAGLGRLLDSLGGMPDAFTVGLSVRTKPHPLHDHVVAIDPRDFVPLPTIDGFKSGVWQHRACQAAIREVEARSDVVIVQLPFAAPTALLGPTRPRVYHVCADVLAIIQASDHYRGLARVAALGAAHGVDQIHRLLFASDKARIVTNGRALKARYAGAEGRAVISSSLLAHEIMSVGRSRPKDGRFRILFVGYLRPEKGVDVLVEAFEQVLRRRPDAELHVVGPATITRQEVAASLRDRVETLVKAGSVTLVGHKSFGPELFQCYADADVLALTSVSEGTPRVLLEARAFGCPVVASDVGGIPTSVRHRVDGLLVPPRDPAALADALLEIASDPALRSQLVERGIERARACTVEAFAQEMYQTSETLLGA